MYDPKFFVLPTLGAQFPLEVVLGMNGRIWIKTVDLKATIAVARCIEAVDKGLVADEATLKKFVNTMDLP